MSCRILIADVEALVRLGIKAVFQSVKDVVICGEATNGIDAIRKAHELSADIIIADPWLAGANGVILTRRTLERHPEQKVLIFGEPVSDVMVCQLLRAGIKGLLLKTDPAADLIDAIWALREDRLYFTPSVEEAVLDQYLRSDDPLVECAPTTSHLTLREQEVAQLLAEGKASKEVGDILGISFRTAATHRSNLMRKLSVHNSVELTLYAAAHQLIQAPSVLVLADVVELPKPALKTTAKAA